MSADESKWCAKMVCKPEGLELSNERSSVQVPRLLLTVSAHSCDPGDAQSVPDAA